MAAGATYEPIETVSASGMTTVTFSSIASSWTDLVLVITGVYSGTTYASFKFNNDSGSNYSWTRILGLGSSVFSDRDSTSDGINLGSSRGITIFNIQNYSNTTTYKTALVRENAADSHTGAYIYLWRNTAAITSISITPKSSATWASGSTLTLYGIAAA